jgi:pyridoxamine 5'-phosphate oxidase
MNFIDPPPEPLAPLRRWIEAATETDLPNPTAITLATVDPDGSPSARMVLLRGLDERGAVFFTNHLSRKGRALAAHPRAAIVLFWDVLQRQVIIEGPVTHAESEESDRYFSSRPREHQIGAWASRQSQPVPSRRALEDEFAACTARFAGKPVPRPPHWGGFRVALERVEFWQGQIFRMHDRIRYTAAPGGAWIIERLSP